MWNWKQGPRRCGLSPGGDHKARVLIPARSRQAVCIIGLAPERLNGGCRRSPDSEKKMNAPIRQASRPCAGRRLRHPRRANAKARVRFLRRQAPEADDLRAACAGDRRGVFGLFLALAVHRGHDLLAGFPRRSANDVPQLGRPHFASSQLDTAVRRVLRALTEVLHLGRSLGEPKPQHRGSV
jgi:hypothetical protein